jgi:hypothetical protein
MDTPHIEIYEHIKNGRLPKLNIVFDLDHTLINSYDYHKVCENKEDIKAVKECLQKGLMKKFSLKIYHSDSKVKPISNIEYRNTFL